MMGIKCKVPNTEFQAKAMEHKLLTIAAGDNVMRVLPPLIVSEAEIADGIERLSRAFIRLSKTGT